MIVLNPTNFAIASVMIYSILLYILRVRQRSRFFYNAITPYLSFFTLLTIPYFYASFPYNSPLTFNGFLIIEYSIKTVVVAIIFFCLYMFRMDKYWRFN